MKNVAKTPLVGGQWRRTPNGPFKYDLLITDNSIAPNAAALLNLTPDHLDRHGNMDRYARVKAGIFANQEAVDTAVAPIVADLDRLTAGTAPQGRPLSVGDRTLTTIRVSDDGRMALLPVQFTAQLNGLSPYALSDLLLVTEQAVEGAGISAYPSSALNPTKPPLGGHEAVGLGFAVLILLLALAPLSPRACRCSRPCWAWRSVSVPPSPCHRTT